MLFYLGHILIFLMYSLLLSKTKNGKKRIIIISGIQFGLLFMLRDYTVGVDTLKYSSKYFHIVNSGSYFIDISSGSPAFTIIMKLWSYVLPESYGYMVITGAVITILVWYFIYKNSDHVMLSIFFYMSFLFYFSSFNVSRQYMAIALILYTYMALKEEKMIMSVIFYALAVMFHSTAVISGVLFLIFLIKWNFKKFAIYTSSLFIVLYMYRWVMNIFIVYFPKYQIYIVGGEISEDYTGSGKSIILYIIYAFVIVLSLWVLYQDKQKALHGNNGLKRNRISGEEENEIWRLCAIVDIAAVMGLIYASDTLFLRLSTLFSVFIIILLPKLLQHLGRNRKLYILASILIMAVPLCYQLKAGVSGVVPYSSYVEWLKF